MEPTRTETLADTSLGAMKLFKQVNSIDNLVENQNRPHKAWPKAQFAAEADRFELWAVNLGVFVSGHGSLDYRVRQAESIRQTLQRFITALNNSLIEVLEYSTTNSDSTRTEVPVDPADDPLNLEPSDCDTESDIDLLLDGVRDPIDRLYKLSTWIRNPSSRFASSKALRHQQIDPESNVDFLKAVESFDYDYVSSLFLQYRKAKAQEEQPEVCPPENKDRDDNVDDVWEPIRTVLSHHKSNLLKDNESFLVRRLARANVRRRQQFSYWKKHRGKLSQHTKAATQDIDIRNDVAPNQLNVDMPVNGASTPMKLPSQSVTTASRLNIPQLTARDDLSNVSISEYAPSIWQPSKEIVDFPPGPKLPSNEKFFECPYCFTLCSRELLTEKAWKAHLIHDLRPYICTYEDCRTPDQLYDTRQDWIQHENSSHRSVLRCPEHLDQTFSKVEEYEEHLREGHVSYDDEVSAILIGPASISTLTSPDRCCPMCSLFLSTAKELQSHIALHLERLSVFSLPRSVGENDDDINEVGSDEANFAFDGSRDEDFDEDLDFTGDSGDVPDIIEAPPATEREPNNETPHDNLSQFKQIAYEGLVPELDFFEHIVEPTGPECVTSDLERHGQYEQAEVMYRRELVDTEKILGPEHVDTLTSVSNIGRVLEIQGKVEEAEAMYRRALAGREKALGLEHPNTLTSMANLASTYMNQGRFEEAEQLELQVLETRKTKLGVDYPDTLTSMGNLASIYRNQGRLEEAEKLFIQIMDTRKTKLGVDHPDTLTSMANLALILWDQGRWEEAEKLDVQVMETRKTKLGVDHPDTLTSMGNLASIYRNQGQLEEAEKLDVQVMQTRKTKLGVDHPDTLTSMGNLASTYRNQGRLEEAEQLGVQVMETRKTKLGVDHPDTLTSMGNLASILWDQGQWKKAEQLELQVLETRKAKFGEDHPDTLMSLANLASLYMNQGRWKEAEQLELQVLETRKAILGEDHPDTLTSMNNLASIYRNQGRWKKAEQLELQVLETRKAIFGKDSSYTLMSLANLASLYMNQGRFEEAEQLELQVLERRKAMLGEDHPDTLTSMNNLASIYRNQGRWKKAEQLELQVLETRKAILGEDHPDTLTSMANLAFTCKSSGHDVEAINLLRDCLSKQKKILVPDHPTTVSNSETLVEWETERLNMNA